MVQPIEVSEKRDTAERLRAIEDDSKYLRAVIVHYGGFSEVYTQLGKSASLLYAACARLDNGKGAKVDEPQLHQLELAVIDKYNGLRQAALDANQWLAVQNPPLRPINATLMGLSDLVLSLEAATLREFAK
jgi:hypothetical protein